MAIRHFTEISLRGLFSLYVCLSHKFCQKFSRTGCISAIIGTQWEYGCQFRHVCRQSIDRSGRGEYWKTSLNTASLHSVFRVGFQREAARICYRAPAPAARRPQLSIDISCSHGAQQQTRRMPLLLSIDGTDRRTLAGFYAGSVNNNR